MKPDAKIATTTLNLAIDQTVAIPNFTEGSVNRVQGFCSDAGGKGVNVAAFLVDYGLPVTATGFFGDRRIPIRLNAFSSKGFD
jgi:1-phosphofructokinase